MQRALRRISSVPGRLQPASPTTSVPQSALWPCAVAFSDWHALGQVVLEGTTGVGDRPLAEGFWCSLSITTEQQTLIW